MKVSWIEMIKFFKKVSFPVVFILLQGWDIVNGIYKWCQKNEFTVGSTWVVTIVSNVIYLVACAFTKSWSPGAGEPSSWYKLLYLWIPGWSIILGSYIINNRHTAVGSIKKWYWSRIKRTTIALNLHELPKDIPKATVTAQEQHQTGKPRERLTPVMTLTRK